MVAECLARAVVILLRQPAQADGTAEPVARAAAAQIGRAVVLFQRAVGGGERAFLPHLQRGVPLQRAVANVVRRGDAAHASAAFARHAASVAAVENGGEVAVVGQLAIEAEKLLVGDGARRRPVEIVGHQAFVQVIDFVAGAVGRYLRAVAGIEQHALVARLHAVEQPVQALKNADGGGALIQHHADVLGGKAAFLQHRAHQEHVVDAALQPVGRIRVVVDADQQRAPRRLAAGFLERRQTARHDTLGADTRQHPPHRTARIGVSQIMRGVVVERVVRDVEAGANFLEIACVQADPGGHHVVVRVVQVKPLLGGAQTFQPTGKGVAHARIADLRAERNEGLALQRRRVAQEGVIADQRAEAVPAHHIVSTRLHFLQHRVARRRTQLFVTHPLRHHASAPAQLLRHLEQPALAREQVAHAVHDAARQHIGKRGGIGQRIERRLLEQRIVLEEVAAHREVGIPRAQAVADRRRPCRLQVGVSVTVADAVYAQDGK